MQDLTSKQEQIENLKQQTRDLERELQSKEEEVTKAQLKFTNLVTLISAFQKTLQSQRTALNDIKVNVQEHYQNIAEQHRKVVSNVVLSCEKFVQEKRVLEESLSEVSTVVVHTTRIILQKLSAEL